MQSYAALAPAQFAQAVSRKWRLKVGWLARTVNTLVRLLIKRYALGNLEQGQLISLTAHNLKYVIYNVFPNTFASWEILNWKIKPA